MADLKPIGSEKLQGDEKLKRILELTYFDNHNTETSANTKVDFICETSLGVYGIVREKDGYYVKRGLNEESLDYIGGLFMKNKNKFPSYASALKRLELIIGEDNLLQEDTRYLLKRGPSTPVEATPPKQDIETPPIKEPQVPASPAPVSSDSVTSDTSMSPDSLPTPDSSTEPEMPEEQPSGDEFGGSEGEESDPIKRIQTATGKLGELIQSNEERIESDDVKYVINSVLSAFGDKLFELDDDDKDEIFNKFEKDTEEDAFSSEEEPSDLEEPEMNPQENEMDETMQSLEELINTPFEDETDIEVEEDPGEPWSGEEDVPWVTKSEESGEMEYDWGFPEVDVSSAAPAKEPEVEPDVEPDVKPDVDPDTEPDSPPLHDPFRKTGPLVSPPPKYSEFLSENKLNKKQKLSDYFDE